ncbi:hypothetical protein Tco_0366738 [Tanacetum coccineum]
MAQLEFCDKHNMVAYLVKSESSKGFDEIIDFLTSSHIYYALTENPIIFVSLIEQFWETAVLSTTEEGLQAISATIDGHEKLITEDSLRRHLKLEDAEGISSLSNEEIFEHLAHMGYVTNSESLTFFKGHFSPNGSFFIPPQISTLFEAPKKTTRDQYHSNIAKHSIRYLQLGGLTFPNSSLKLWLRTWIAHTNSYCIPAHDEEQQQLPSRITSTPSLSRQPTPSSPSPEPIQPTYEAQEIASMPHDSPFHAIHSHGSAEGSVQQHDLMVFGYQLERQEDSSKQMRWEDRTRTIEVSTASPTKVLVPAEPQEKYKEKCKDKGKGHNGRPWSLK